jgi:hypothetical protein
MKLWIDDVRPAPEGYEWCRSVNQAKNWIDISEFDFMENIELIDIDHNAGEYVSDGGDYIKLLDWLEETGRNYPIHIHSDNQINLLWMREIIERNGWKEV